MAVEKNIKKELCTKEMECIPGSIFEKNESGSISESSTSAGLTLGHRNDSSTTNNDDALTTASLALHQASENSAPKGEGGSVNAYAADAGGFARFAAGTMNTGMLRHASVMVIEGNRKTMMSYDDWVKAAPAMPWMTVAMVVVAPHDGRAPRHTARKGPKPSLLGIPGEIRNKIYQHLNFKDGVVCLHCPVTQHATEEERYLKPALLRVCRKLRYETSAWYYSSNRFDMTCSWTDADASCSKAHGGNGLLDFGWLNSIGDYRYLLRDIKFRLPGCETWTRFQLKEFGVGECDLYVSTGRPLSEGRALLLKLLVEGFFYSERNISPHWTGELLISFLYNLYYVLTRVEAVATPVRPLGWKRNLTYSEGAEGFIQLVCPDVFEDEDPEVVNWDALCANPQREVAEHEHEEGALLVLKDGVVPYFFPPLAVRR